MAGRGEASADATARMKTSSCIAVAVLCASLGCHSQTIGTGQTVRKHRVAEENPVSAALAQAETAIDKQDYPAAEKALNDAIKLDPEEYRAWYYLGFVSSAQHRTDEAIKDYRKAVELNPTAFEPALNLGLVLAQSNSPEAEKYLRAATGLKPSAQPEIALANAYLALGRVQQKSSPKQALESYLHAAQLKPKDHEPHLLAGEVAQKLGDTATAQREYQRASELAPNSPDALIALTNLYLDAPQPMPEKAEPVLKKLLALDPQNPRAHLQLGKLLVNSNPQQAQAEFDAAQKLAPNDPALARQVASLYERAKLYDKAEGQLRLLAQKSPQDADLHYELGNALLKQKKFPEAEQEMMMALQVRPNFLQAYEALAITAAENKDYPTAIHALDGRARLAPDTPGTYFLRATSYDNLKDYKRAAENYHHFLETANGKFPDQEWQARHRLVAIEPKR